MTRFAPRAGSGWARAISRTLGGVHLAQARGGPVPSHGRSVGFTSRRLGVGPCHLADARFGHPWPPLRSENSSLRHPGCARISTPLDWHGPTPREPVFRLCACVCAKKPPGASRGDGGLLGFSRSPEAQKDSHNPQPGVTRQKRYGLALTVSRQPRAERDLAPPPAAQYAPAAGRPSRIAAASPTPSRVQPISR